MITIGLTGGIASGKSTVSAMLAELGAFVVDADKIAREIVAPHQPAYNDIVAEFGPQVLDAAGNLNRQVLAEIIFNDVIAKQRLERITHPRIRQRMLELRDSVRGRYEVVVFDVPLLIEKGWGEIVDTIWVVYVNRATQIARLMARDRLTREQAEARIANQMSLDEKVKYADVVIDNNRDVDHLRRQVLAAWQSIIDSRLAYAETE